MAKTNTGLVAYAKAQLGRPYWYGCYGNTATTSLLDYKRKQYPDNYYQAKYKVKFTDQLGQRVHDCVGLIKGYLWSEGPDAAPKYNGNQDVSANGMLNRCTEKGSIGTMPELPGVLVFMSGHVGVYIGGGYVIEARGHDYGVVKTALKNRPWTNWGKCPWITYTTTPAKEEKATEATTAAKTAYFKKYTGTSVSIVDGLCAVGAKSSFSYRSQIAKANGVKSYIGTAAQNRKLLELLKAGKLIKP